MSTKRAFYKPACQESILSHRKRPTLAQGRLVEDALGSASSNLKQHNIAKAGPGDVHTLVAHDAEAGPSVRNVLGSQMKAVTTSPKHGQPDDIHISPRRQMPVVSEHNSPKPARPSEALEISDSESDILFSPTKAHSPKDVLVMDASHQTQDPNQSEVDILLGYEHSPARVTCHTQAAILSNLRNTGDVAEARRIEIDTLPTVTVISDSANKNRPKPTDPSPVTRFKSPAVVREKGVPGGIRDLECVGRPEVVKSLFPPQPHEDSGEYDRGRHYAPLKMMLEHAESETSMDGSDRLSDSSELSERANKMSKSKSISFNTTDANHTKSVKKKKVPTATLR